MTTSSTAPGGEHALAPAGRAVLEVRGLTKAYPGVRALGGVDLELRRGEVRALLGKNGAGKSTLVRILSGVVTPDSGEIFVDGELADLSTPSRASGLGIQTVHQELSLVPEMSVAENIALGAWHKVRGALGVLDRRVILEQATKVLALLEVDIDPRTKISSLSVAHRQVIEIAKALAHEPSVLILDEPTSSLPAEEVHVLLSLIKRLVARGISVIYVSHRMQEIPQIADSVTVLRDGELIATLPIESASTQKIVELMTGDTAHEHLEDPRDRTGERVVLAVKDLESTPMVQGVSFELHEGEILGLAGLLGSGRTETLRCVFGLDRIDSGEIQVGGRPVSGQTPKSMVRAGVGMTPEDRAGEGLALGLSVSANVVMGCLDRIRRGAVVSGLLENRLARSIIERLGIKVRSPETICGTLSGGNQQKALVGRWLAAESEVILMDEPTRGVDIDAKRQFYAQARLLAHSGVSILVVSSEIEELFAMCDRLVVLNGGRTVANLPTADTTLDEVMALTMEGAV